MPPFLLNKERNSTRKTVLFLGQVYTDSAVFKFISKDNFPTQAHLIQHVIAYVQGRADLNLVVRTHPKETMGANNQETVNALRRHAERGWNSMNHLPLLQSRGGRFLLDHTNRWNTYDLIRNSDVVVTVNSQVGLEAAALGKPVITTAPSFYSGGGFATEVSTQALRK